MKKKFIFATLVAMVMSLSTLGSFAKQPKNDLTVENCFLGCALAGIAIEGNPNAYMDVAQVGATVGGAMAVAFGAVCPPFAAVGAGFAFQ